MIHRPWRRAIPRMAASVSRSAVHPVGLAGLLMNSARVRGVTAASIACGSQPPAALRRALKLDCDIGRAADADGGRKVRPGGAQMDDLIAMTGDRIQRHLDRLHARPRDDEFLRLERPRRNGAV